MTSSDLDLFKENYRTFINNLPDSKKESLQYMLKSESFSSKNREISELGADCDCQSWESKCSAEGSVSSCCVCWDPKKETGACGTYFGIASCKTERKDETIDPARTKTESTIQIAYARFVNKLQSFGRSENTNIDVALSALHRLKKQSK